MKARNEDGPAYLLSFLALIVHRAGGEMVLENLSEIAGTNLVLGYDLDKEGDRVRLAVEEAG